MAQPSWIPPINNVFNKVTSPGLASVDRFVVYRSFQHMSGFHWGAHTRERTVARALALDRTSDGLKTTRTVWMTCSLAAFCFHGYSSVWARIGRVCFHQQIVSLCVRQRNFCMTWAGFPYESEFSGFFFFSFFLLFFLNVFGHFKQDNFWCKYPSFSTSLSI